MSVSVDLDALLTYSEHERGKWREWLGADPRRCDLPLQPGGRFATVGGLLDHIFLVERRHLSRLQGATPPEATGVASSDVDGLFGFAELVRADLRRYVSDLDDRAGDDTLTFTIPNGTFTMTRRKLAVHIVLHEVRHLAQVALAARTAGHAPPGEHDIFFCPELP